MKKIDANVPGNVEEDKRGKHGKQPKVSDDTRKGVSEFIDAIPKIPSHYLRKKTKRLFISGDRSIAQLYRDYAAEARANDNLPCSESMFSVIFNDDWNIG